MSKQRAINTKFWSDPWVRDELNPLDRYLFLYFLTNEHTNISGVYELPIATIAFETGIDREELERSMIKRLRPKVIYQRNWVIIPRFAKHQNLKSNDVRTGIEREFKNAPEIIQKEAISRGWGDGLGMVPRESEVLNLTKPNSITVADAPVVDVPIGKDEPTKRGKIPKDDQALSLVRWAEKRRGFDFTSVSAQLGAIGRAKRANISPTRLRNRWEELEGETWRNGFDWVDVVKSFDKRA